MSVSICHLHISHDAPYLSLEMPSKKKKKKRKPDKKSERGGKERKCKVKVETALSFLNPTILFSVRARTSDSYILYTEEKEAKCSTYERRFGQFWFLIARQ